MKIEANAVRLEVMEAASVHDSDAVQSRIRQLAKVAGVEGAEVVSECANQLLREREKQC